MFAGLVLLAIAVSKKPSLLFFFTTTRGRAHIFLVGFAALFGAFGFREFGEIFLRHGLLPWYARRGSFLLLAIMVTIYCLVAAFIDSGIFGEKHNPFSKKDSISVLYERYRSKTLNNPSSLADENQLCIVKAQGKGNLTFLLDNIFHYFMYSGALLLVFGVFLPPLLPIVAPVSLMLIFGGLAGLFINHLIPFRFLFPQLGMNLTTGDCSINGLNGSQHFPAPLNATFSGFNGLTVNFYTTKDPSVFLLGFALKSVVF